MVDLQMVPEADAGAGDVKVLSQGDMLVELVGSADCRLESVAFSVMLRGRCPFHYGAREGVVGMMEVDRDQPRFNCRGCGARGGVYAFAARLWGMADGAWRTGRGGGKRACRKRAVFRTKAQLAQGMIERAIGSGVPFAWVAGNTVYGNDRKLRGWLEEQGRCYVLAVKNNEPLWADTERGSTQVAARDLAHEIPDDQWQRLSAGDGSKGPRLYDWGWLPIRPWSEPEQGHWLLVRAWSRARVSPILRTWPTTPVSVGEGVAGGTGARGGHPLDHRRCLQGVQTGGGAGRVPGTSVGRVVPAHHPGPAGPCLSGGNPVLRRWWRW